MDSPRLDKLFHVLVILGAASCGEDDAERRDRAVDAAAVSTPDGAGAAPCFCNVDTCCDRTGAEPVLQAGFTCCWSTSCD